MNAAQVEKIATTFCDEIITSAEEWQYHGRDKSGVLVLRNFIPGRGTTKVRDINELFADFKAENKDLFTSKPAGK